MRTIRCPLRQLRHVGYDCVAYYARHPHIWSLADASRLVCAQWCAILDPPAHQWVCDGWGRGNGEIVDVGTEVTYAIRFLVCTASQHCREDGTCVLVIVAVPSSNFPPCPR